MKPHLALLVVGLALVVSGCSYEGIVGVTAGDRDGELVVRSGCGEEGIGSVSVASLDRRGVWLPISVAVPEGEPDAVVLNLDDLREQGLRFPLTVRASAGPFGAPDVVVDRPTIEPGLVLVGGYPETEAISVEEFEDRARSCGPSVWPPLIVLGVVSVIVLGLVAAFVLTVIWLVRRSRRGASPA